MSYPSDLTDAQWEMIKDHFSTGNYGKSRTHKQRDLINAVFYIIKSGCQWRMLPQDFPPYSTHSFYWRAKNKGIWEKMVKDLVTKSRIKMGRNPNPSYSLIDSQSVKTTDKAVDRGIDGGEIKGRKRHIVTDTRGHLLHVNVHAANTHDTVAGCAVFKEALKKYPTLKGVCADAGYRKAMEEFLLKRCWVKQLRFLSVSLQDEQSLPKDGSLSALLRGSIILEGFQKITKSPLNQLNITLLSLIL